MFSRLMHRLRGHVITEVTSVYYIGDVYPARRLECNCGERWNT